MNSYDILISHDIKPSVQRLAILEYLYAYPTHPTADEIYNALSPSIPTLSKTTVYNTLKLFTLNKVAQAITIDEHTEHFDGDTSVHAHFLCKKCGKIYDATIKGENIPGEEKFKNEGHVIDEAYLYYKGICKYCQK